MIKNPNWKEADKLTLYQYSQGVQLRTDCHKVKIQLVIKGSSPPGPGDLAMHAAS